MAKYRYKDRTETNPFGQTLGYVDWIGGTELTYVGGILCADGCKRNWFKTGEALNAFAVPGYVHVKGKKVHGVLVAEHVEEWQIKDNFLDGVSVVGIRYKFHEWPKVEQDRVIPISHYA
jgi:hypothetical protein